MVLRLIERGAVSLLVSDVGRAVRFYTEALEFTLRLRRGDEYAEVEMAGVTIALTRAGDPGWRALRALPMSIALDVERLEGAMLVLRERGVRFAPEIAERDGERVVFFTDDDGTPLFLRERKG